MSRDILRVTVRMYDKHGSFQCRPASIMAKVSENRIRRQYYVSGSIAHYRSKSQNFWTLSFCLELMQLAAKDPSENDTLNLENCKLSICKLAVFNDPIIQTELQIAMKWNAFLILGSDMDLARYKKVLFLKFVTRWDFLNHHFQL